MTHRDKMTWGGRTYWIDFLRSFAMLLVIIGHSYSYDMLYFVFTSPIKIPLFFTITGFIFRERDGKTDLFFKHLFWRIIIPWIVLSLLPLKLLNAILHFDDGTAVQMAWRYIYNFLSGETIWYMPCCIIAEVIHFFIRKYCKKRFIQYIFMLIFMGTGICMSLYNIGNFAHFNTACIAQGYMFVGMFIKNHVLNISDKCRKMIVISFTGLYIFFAALTLLLYPGECMDVHLNMYYNYLLCFGMIVTGCVVCFLTAERIEAKLRTKKLESIYNIFVFIGQNTLVYYMLHSYVSSVFFKIAEELGILIQEGLICSMLIVIVDCIGCGMIAIFLKRYVPILVGRKILA